MNKNFFIPSKFLLFCFTAILFSACNFFNKDKVTLNGKNFGDEIDLQQNLTFSFSEDLAADSLMEDWLATEYIKFSPEVKGKFQWKTPRELVFSPELGFLPSTDYEATLTNELVANLPEKDKKLKLDGETTIKFHTPYLTLINSEAYWGANTQGGAEMRLNLNFNYRVNPAEVGKLTTIAVEQQNATFRLLTNENAATVQLAVAPAAGVKYDKKVADIRIGKGLTLPEGKYEAAEMKFETEIPDQQDFRVLNVAGIYEAESPVINITTNQAVGMTPAQIAQSVQVEPAVQTEVTVTEFGFLLKGKFESSANYKITVQKNLRGILGSNLADNFEQFVAFSEMQPSIKFPNRKAVYLTSKGQRNVVVQILGVPKVRISVYKIFNNNINGYLRDKVGFSDYNYEDYYYDESSSSSGIEDYGSEVFSQEYETNKLHKGNGGVVFNMDFIDRLPDYKGIYVLVVHSATDQWKRAAKVVAFSDIGLMARQTDNDIWVFANSILTAQPLKDVEVKLVSNNNQEIYTAKTDGDGVAKFENLKKKTAGFTVTMITAQQATNANNDFTYMHFNQAAINMSRFETGGIRFTADEYQNKVGQYQAFIYGDRELYRPDETVFLKTILRDKTFNPVPFIPIKLRVLLPDGKEFANLRGTLTEQGSFETSIKLGTSAVTGSYTIEVYTSNDIFLNSKTFNVEEFMPDRIKVTGTLDKESYQAAEQVIVKATAMNLFGTPATNRKYEIAGTLNRKSFSPKGFDDYNFTILGAVPNIGSLPLQEGETDDKGEITHSYTLPEVKFAGLLDGDIFVTVFDETGRTVSTKKGFEVETQKLFYGLKMDDYYVATRSAIPVGLVALNKQGQAATSAKGKLTIIRYDWQSALEKDYYGNFRYVSHRKEVLILSQEITIQGKGTTFPFVANRSGEYEIRLTAADNNQTYVSNRFYAYGWGYTDNTSFEVDKDGEIKIVADKEKYKVGDKAKFLLKTPFEGRILVTVEQGNLHKYLYVNSDKKAAEVEIDIKDEYMPNMYLTATLIKPADQTAIPLTVAHGFQSVTVENDNNVIPLEIKAVEKSRSGIKQEIVVQCGKKEANIEVTLAVVDEGILLKKAYQNPNPYDFFFQKRALEVKGYDMYPRLFPEIKTLPKQYGADDYDLGNRTNPLANKRVKLLSFWSGTLKTNSNGEVRYAVQLPQFSGSVRIVAVAAKNSAFGSAAKNMIVADPVVLSTSLPRFLSPNDEVNVKLTLMNTTNKATTGTATLGVSGAVQLTSNATEQISLPANGEKVVEFKVKAANLIGTAKINAGFTAGGEKYAENLDITVRPSTSLLKTSNSGVIKGNETLNLKADYVESSVTGKLVIAKSPVVQFAKNLAYLVQYPYGCVEQTTSTAFPQMYFGEIAKSLGDEKLKSLNPQRNVQEAIQKLQTMQMYNGALSYWEGGTYESWWGTVYATHFVTESKRAGFEVDKKFLDKLLAYLEMKVKRKNTQDYIYFDAENKRIVGRTAPKEVAYSLYVLALCNQADKATMNYYKANPSLLPLDSKYLLAAAYQLIGDKGSARTLLPAKFEGERAAQEFDGSFASPIRDEAIALNCLIDTDPKNAQIEVMARHLSQEMKNAAYLNTQENAFGLLALGKLAKQANENGANAATITANGSKVGSFNGTALTLTKEVAGKEVKIDVQGGGTLYYYYEIQGLNTSGAYKEEDNYLKIRRSFYDRNGSKLSSNSFEQGELVVVRLDLQAINTTAVPNVVVTDMLPAGFEIENPRLGNVPGITWIKDAASAEHFDFRDDRVNIFVGATSSVKSFYYVVRCVSAGNFRMGPASADAMYNGEYHSYNGGGEVEVK